MSLLHTQGTEEATQKKNAGVSRMEFLIGFGLKEPILYLYTFHQLGDLVPQLLYFPCWKSSMTTSCSYIADSFSCRPIKKGIV